MLSSFDLISDSLLVCFPVLTHQNNVLAFIQDLSGNLIKELKIEEQVPDGPIYNENPVIHRVNDGFIYMPFPLNTVYFIDSMLETKQVLFSVSKNEDKMQFMTYRILFPNRDRLIIAAKTNVFKNDGTGCLVLFPENEKFYELDLINDKISFIRDNENKFPDMSFYNPGYIVITSAKQCHEYSKIRIGETDYNTFRRRR